MIQKLLIEVGSYKVKPIRYQVKDYSLTVLKAL